MNRSLGIKQGFQNSLKTYHQEAVVQRRIAETLASHLDRHVSSPDRLLEIGCGTGFLTQKLENWSRSGLYYLNDLNEDVESLFDKRYRFIAGDAEECDLPDRLDAIVSASAVQWFCNLSRFFDKSFDLLNPNGVLAFSTFGADHFQELRRLTGNGLVYFSPQDLIESLKAKGFQILFSDEEIISVYFEKPVDVLRHLRQTGVNGDLQPRWSIKRLRQFQAQYEEFFSTEQGLPLTFHPIYLIAKKQVAP